MTQLAEFKLDNGGLILFEVDEDRNLTGTTMRGTSAALSSLVQASQDFGTALDTVKDAAQSLMEHLITSMKPPSELKIDFGIKLTAQAGAVIAKAATEAHFVVSLTWKQEQAIRE